MVRAERIEGPSKCLFTGLRLMPVLEWPQKRVTSRVPICRPVAVLTQSRPHVLLVPVCADVCVFLQRNHRSPGRLFSHHGDHRPLVATLPKAEIGKRTLPIETIQDRFNLPKTLLNRYYYAPWGSERWSDLSEVTQLDTVESMVSGVR